MTNDAESASIVVISALAVAAGIGLIYLIYKLSKNAEREKFYRRNKFGVEEFDNFDAANRSEWKSKAIDQLNKIIGTLAILLIVGGLLGIFVGASAGSSRTSVEPAYSYKSSMTCSEVSAAAISESRGKEFQIQLKELSNEQEISRSSTRIECKARGTWADGTNTDVYTRMSINSDGGSRVIWSDGPIP